MWLIIECIIICFLMFVICYKSTGTDDKNIKGFKSYPKEVQEKLRKIEKYKGKIKEESKVKIFISNFIMFLIIFFIFGLFIKVETFLGNFMNILVLGQVLNVFDLLFIDLIWWRNSKRIRFSEIEDEVLYRNPRKHIESFFRAFIMYTLIAIVDGILLTIF